MISELKAREDFHVIITSVSKQMLSATMQQSVSMKRMDLFGNECL